MKYNLLVVTDHTTHSETNSVYALCQAFRREDRLNHVWVCTRGDLRNADFFEGIPGAWIYAVAVSPHFVYHPDGLQFDHHSERVDSHDIDVILVRMPQPLHPAFLFHLSSIVPPHHIINRPEGSIQTSSKAFLLEVSHLCPEPVLCHSLQEAVRLSQEKEIVLKPLYSYGGRGILRISRTHGWQANEPFDIRELSSIIKEAQFPMMAFRFLKNVTMGDKRTIVVHQQILGSALRLPAPGSWMCNVAQGGHAVLSEMDEAEIIIERQLTPLLYRKGVIMYGFDTLVNDDGRRVLSEINTLSIGGLLPLQELSGQPILQQTASLLLDHIESGP